MKRRIAIPIDEGNLGCQLGKCKEFAIYELNASSINLVENKTIGHASKDKEELLNWLKEINISDLISHHIDKDLAQFLLEHKINIFVGAPLLDPASLVNSYINGSLISDENILYQAF